ncbi:MAG: Asp-tRNA(Asn)/Glu-tRNA(Gln) amidotransferase subunit GatB [Gemmatimonadota bacterium]
MSWETVIGVEVHVQLKTERKLFCGCAVTFGDRPNAHVCPTCLGLPGALPAVNPDAVKLAVRTALSLDCTVHERSVWARKNYVYPDLPKGYQITQFEAPIATDGRLEFDTDAGPRQTRIRRIHMEEDAGKLVHDRVPDASVVDLNRAGTPLVEIVTDPDLHSAEDVRACLTELKRVLEFMRVSDCNMEEGSLRADANVSLRPMGSTELGTKTEIKNVNSFSGIEKAIHLEVDRQREVLDRGDRVSSATLLWDDHRGSLRVMRSKEESHDYRYFPDPDLPVLVVSRSAIEEARDALPERPRELRDRLRDQYGLSSYDAGVLAHRSETAAYFEAVVGSGGEAKAVANWVMGPVQALLNSDGRDIEEIGVAPTRLAELIGLVVDGTVSDGNARRVLNQMESDVRTPAEIVEAEGFQQVRDEGALAEWVSAVLSEHGEEVDRYRAGETKILGFLVGKVMRQSGGRADPRLVNDALKSALER